MCRGIIISFALLVVYGTILAGVSKAQTRSNCPDVGRELVFDIYLAVRGNPDDDSKPTKRVIPGYRYHVIDSYKQSTFICQVETPVGWVKLATFHWKYASGDENIGDVEAIPTVVSNTARTTITANDRCYTASKAYITGAMNIRSGPGTGNRKVGSAQAGESFSVSRSQRGGEYCWLKVNKGWIAKTGRVSSTKPTVARRVAEPSATNTTGLPGIQGSASFGTKVIRAWNYLRGKSSKWFNYAISANFSVIEESWRTGVGLPSRRMEIISDPSYTDDIVVLSSIYVHEACHVRQWNEGRHHGRTKVDRESECYDIQADAVSEYAPHARSYIAALRRGVPGHSK